MLSKSYINAAMKNQLLLDYLKDGPFMYFSNPNPNPNEPRKCQTNYTFVCLLVCVDAFIARRWMSIPVGLHAPANATTAGLAMYFTANHFCHLHLVRFWDNWTHDLPVKKTKLSFVGCPAIHKINSSCCLGFSSMGHNDESTLFFYSSFSIFGPLRCL